MKICYGDTQPLKDRSRYSFQDTKITIF